MLPIEGVLVFLVGDERMNLAAAHQHDVARLGAAQVFLQEDALGVVDVLQPRPRVLDRLAQNRVNRTGRRAERILDDERLRMARRIFSASSRLRATYDCGKGNFELGAEVPGKIALALDSHRLAGGTENTGTPERSNSSAHGACAQSMDCGMTTSTPCCLSSGTGLGKASREKAARPATAGKWP